VVGGEWGGGFRRYIKLRVWCTLLVAVVTAIKNAEAENRVA